MAAPDWWDDAKCRLAEIPVTRFFAKEEAQEIKKFCSDCPVRYICLKNHLTEPFGVWGGHPRDERAKVRFAMEQGATLENASRSVDKRRRNS